MGGKLNTAVAIQFQRNQVGIVAIAATMACRSGTNINVARTCIYLVPFEFETSSTWCFPVYQWCFEPTFHPKNVHGKCSVIQGMC